MKKLDTEKTLFLLAYAGTPGLSKFFEKNPNLNADLKIRAACIYHLAQLVITSKKHNEYQHGTIGKLFQTKEVGIFFNSITASGDDDLRDIVLIKNLIKIFYDQTDSGSEAYADFQPFTAFEYSPWLELIARLQKSHNIPDDLKEILNLFIKKGFDLILHPSLNEYGNGGAIKFFACFEKLEFTKKEELITEAIETWRQAEDDEYYNISEDYSKNWYVAGLGFATRMTSKKYVSKVFAENFKEKYAELYEKFRKLADLDEYQIQTPAKNENQEKLAKQSIWEMFAQYKHKPEELAKMLSKDVNTDDLSKIIFAIMADVADSRYDHVGETLCILIEKHPGCKLVKVLTSLFTKNLETKVENNTFSDSDLPPDKHYINNPELNWLTEYCYK